MTKRWRSLYPVWGMSALIPLATWLSAEDFPSAVAVPGGGVVTEAGDGRVGSVSCSGRGCHGKVAPSGTEGSEYNTWANRDPHSSAYLTLFDCRSESIQRSLRRTHPGPETLPPYEDPLCMSCHGRPDSPDALQSLGVVDCADADLLATAIGPSGVGCEECHGRADAWLDVHYRPGWPERYPEAAEAMQPLSRASEKAEVCLSCHVGDGLDRQVNHDLIAAGHPRLNFEFLSHSDRMPQHWDRSITDAKRRAAKLPDPDPAAAWAVGQLASLKGSLELLADRARSAAGESAGAPWPEFSEYACFACHHSLVDGGLHYSRSSGIPGSLTWGSWTLPMSRAVLAELAPQLVASVDSIEGLMGQPYPDANLVSEEAGRLASELGSYLKTSDDLGFPTDRLRAMLNAIGEDPARFETMAANWDASSQLYLGARALLRSEVAALDGGALPPDQLEGLRMRIAREQAALDALGFPSRDLDSPGPRGEPSPWADDPGPIVEAIRELLRASPAEP